MINRAKLVPKGFSLLELVIVMAIVFTLATMAVPQFMKAINNYRVNNEGRQLQALATRAHVQAAANNTRYRVQINTVNRTYTLQFCADAVATRVNPCVTWTTDATTGTITMNPIISFSTTGLTVAPPITCTTPPCVTVTQATEMTFNSRGLLFDETANAPANNRCFYLAGTNSQNIAVCTVLTGRSVAYVLNAGAWVEL